MAHAHDTRPHQDLSGARRGMIPVADGCLVRC
jgi:hypothetical protein